MINRVFLLTIMTTLGFSAIAQANAYPLALICVDTTSQKELYIYEAPNMNWKSTITIRDIASGKVTSELREIHIGVHPKELNVWPTLFNNHGGVGSIFHADYINGALIGSGLGLNNARCTYFGE